MTSPVYLKREKHSLHFISVLAATTTSRNDPVRRNKIRTRTSLRIEMKLRFRSISRTFFSVSNCENFDYEAAQHLGRKFHGTNDK